MPGDEELHSLLWLAWRRGGTAFDEETESPFPSDRFARIPIVFIARRCGVIPIQTDGEVFQIRRKEVDDFDVGTVAEVLKGERVFDVVGRGVLVGFIRYNVL